MAAFPPNARRDPFKAFAGGPFELSSEILALAERMLAHFNDLELEQRLAKKFGADLDEVD